MTATAVDPDTIVPEPPGPAPDRAPDWVAAGTPEPLRSQLVAALGADRVLSRALDLIRYASDASAYRLIPQAVAVPRDVQDMAKLLRCATELGVPVTFRAGGTSLNGQSQTDAILVDVRRHWRRVRVEDDGARLRAQPGVVLGHANRLLARRGRRIGPDPASTNIACVGGVVANNSGGMRCGVIADSYRTVSAMTLVLANGSVINTADADAEAQFAAAAPELAAGLARIRDRIRSDDVLAERIARKFQIKNTTGYRLCAFLDADTPLEIFRRLVVGSEGTLAFVAEAVFDTVPLGRHTTLALVGFEDLDAAAAAVGELVDVRRDRHGADGGTDADCCRLEHARDPGGVEGDPTDLRGAAHRIPRRDPRGARARWRRPRTRSSASAVVTARSTRPPRPSSPGRRRTSRCSGACARACRACSPPCARPASP